MNYIVMDLEWNQAADRKTKQENELLFEIIEIGAVKLDENRRIVDTFHELIKPQVHQKMHQITGELIHLRIEQLDSCRCFVEVMQDFLTWCGKDYRFCTWGNLDLIELQRNMEYYQMEPLAHKPLEYYDVQKLFSIAFEDRKSRKSLEYAVDYLEIKKDKMFHRADTDAYYTARIMERIEDEAVFAHISFDTFHLPRKRKDEIRVVFDNYEKYISQSFPDKIEAMKNRKVTAMKCFLCNGPTKRKITWFPANSKHYYAVSFCEEHGYLKGKIRMRKSVHDELYVVKTIKLIDEAAVEEIRKKKDQLREIRKEKRRLKNETKADEH